jgi:molybdate transport system regulatory protein
MLKYTVPIPFDTIVKITLAAGNGKIFCPPEIAELLSAIEDTGDIKCAAKKADISYSGARLIIKRLEEKLGFDVVVRKSGGEGGGRAYLTPMGRLFMTQYNAFLKTCNSAANSLFSGLYPRGISISDNNVLKDFY